MQLRHRLHRWLHSEYWPSWTYYLPLAPLFLYHVIRNRDVGFYAHANPAMETGGLSLIHKWSMYQMLPKSWIPKTIPIEDPQTSDVPSEANQLQPPFIIKPSYGCRGRGVQEAHSIKDVQEKIKTYHEPILIQEKCTYPMEAGIFIARLPNEPTHITGIVSKTGIEVIGDGKRSLLELLLQNPRYSKHVQTLAEEVDLSRVPMPSEHVSLSTIGNHARGATFVDESFRIDDALEGFMNRLMNEIQGFNYGRFDIRFTSWELLKQGKEFCIIELNGANSEPAHMYDPKHSYFFAIKELYRHWNLLGKISKASKVKNKRVGLSTSLRMLFNGGRI